MLKELDRIVLTTDIPSESLKEGDAGTIVHVYGRNEAFEVEFMTLDGHTAAVATVELSQVRPVTKRDITHARSMETAA